MSINMFAAVTEGRQFNEAPVAIRCSERLRKNGAENVAVLVFGPAVGDAGPSAVSCSQVDFKKSADALYRRSVNGFAIEWRAGFFDPDASNNSNVMTAHNYENLVMETDRMPAFVRNCIFVLHYCEDPNL